MPPPTRLCLGCHLPLPPDAGPRRKYHDATCANAFHNRAKVAQRSEERAERRAERAAEMGPRICALDGCEIDISDRGPRATTCSDSHRVLLVAQRRRERELADAQAKR